MITISIDVKQLQKERFKKVTKKNGEEAIYAELVLIETPGGQYGDYMVKQSVTKEEREKGVQLPILGNGKIRGASLPKSNSPIDPADIPGAAKSDDVPF